MRHRTHLPGSTSHGTAWSTHDEYSTAPPPHTARSGSSSPGGMMRRPLRWASRERAFPPERDGIAFGT